MLSSQPLPWKVSVDDKRLILQMHKCWLVLLNLSKCITNINACHHNLIVIGFHFSKLSFHPEILHWQQLGSMSTCCRRKCSKRFDTANSLATKRDLSPSPHCFNLQSLTNFVLRRPVISPSNFSAGMRTTNVGFPLCLLIRSQVGSIGASDQTPPGM